MNSVQEPYSIVRNNVTFPNMVLIKFHRMYSAMKKQASLRKTRENFQDEIVHEEKMLLF